MRDQVILDEPLPNLRQDGFVQVLHDRNYARQTLTVDG